MVDKNKDKFDIDTMDIKSHLDTSFDIDNIKVSEELIAKTLKAVKASENEKTKSTDLDHNLVNSEDLVDLEEADLIEDSNSVDNVINIESNKKKLRFLPIKIATVAAALFVFVVGIYTMNNGMMSKKDSKSNGLVQNESSSSPMDTGSDKADYDKEVMDDARVEVDKVTGEGMEEKNSLDFKVTMSDEESDALDKPEYSNTEDYYTSSINANTFIISNLYPIEDKTIKEFTIKDKNNKLILATNQIEEVKEVYNILNEHPLTMGENKTLEYIYQLDILTDDDQSYTILIGSGIYAKTLDELEYTYYEIDNGDELLVKLEDFISTLP